MTLHRRDTPEIDRLDAAYARLFHAELSVVLGGKLTGLQRSRMAFLRHRGQAARHRADRQAGAVRPRPADDA